MSIKRENFPSHFLAIKWRNECEFITSVAERRRKRAPPLECARLTLENKSFAHAIDAFARAQTQPLSACAANGRS